jgi:alanine racemase
VALRRVLDRDRRVLVLDGLAAGGAEACVEHGLVPVLNHPGDVARWREEVVRRRRRLPAAVQLDTGMCRLGLSAAEARALAAERPGGVDLVLVMSHLACAEVPDNPLNGEQLARFGELAGPFGGVPRSLASSSGIFLGPAYRFQLCRPGVALYGVNPTPGLPNPVRPVVRVEAPVLQVHEVDAPGSVGYGATRATRPGERIATIPVGYADGFPRAAGADYAVRFEGAELPLAGRVSMDLVTVDASAAPGLGPGSVVEVLGGPDGVDRLADAAGTIGYEVLTRLGRRFERVYLDDEEDGTVVDA